MIVNGSQQRMVFLYSLSSYMFIDANMDAGYHSIVWNADRFSSGMYFVKMVAGEFVNTQKLMLVK